MSWAEGLGDWSKGVPEAGKGAETGSCGEEHVLKVVQLGEPERAGRGDGPRVGAQPACRVFPRPQDPSHEVAALGSILVYLALVSVPIPIPPVWPSCQLSRSL